MPFAGFHNSKTKSIGEDLLAGPLIENNRETGMVDEERITKLLVPDGTNFKQS
jgi:hypothetical protein